MANTTTSVRSSKYRDADKTRLIPSVTIETTDLLKKPA